MLFPRRYLAHWSKLRNLSRVSLLIILGLCVSDIAIAATITRVDPAQTLVISQTVSGTRDGVTSRINSRLSSVNTTSGTRSATLLDAIEALPRSAVLRARDYGSGMPQSELLNDARTNIAQQRPQLIASLAAMMRERGIQSAVFNYDQQVSVAGATRPKRLVWTLLLDQSSRALYGNAQLRDEEPMLLRVVYTPRAVTTGLPSEWAYPESGKLSWQLVNVRMQPQMAPTTIDTNGAFDALPPTPGMAIESEAMLQCLVDARSRAFCPRSLPDVRQLIDQTGATGAIVDYVNRVVPVYDAVESPMGSGRFEQVARHAMRIDERWLSRAECGGNATYRNRGAYGFLLNSRVDRYAVNASGATLRLNSVAAMRASPVKPFDVSRRVNATEVAQLDQWVINPTDPGGSLLNTASLQNVAFMAPLRNGAQSDQVMLRNTSSEWRNGRVSAVSVDCDTDSGTIRFIAGFALGSTPQFITPRYAFFQPGQPASQYFETREDGQHTPCRAMAQYDGARAVRFEPDLGCDFGANMYRHLATLSPNVTAACAAGTFALPDHGPSVCFACPAGGTLKFERVPGYVPTPTRRPVCESFSGWNLSQTEPRIVGAATFTITW